MTYTYTSVFNPLVTVQVDPWAANPLLDDAEQSAPALVNVARERNGEPPTMFSTGDLPLFLASGVDPQYLRYLPYLTRHAAAQEPNSAMVLSYVERFSSEPDALIESEGLADYRNRFRGWLRGVWTNPNFAGPDAEQATAADDAMYGALFGAAEAKQRAEIEAVNAQQAAFRAAQRPR